jgi:hypothetical protein
MIELEERVELGEPVIGPRAYFGTALLALFAALNFPTSINAHSGSGCACRAPQALPNRLASRTSSNATQICFPSLFNA